MRTVASYQLSLVMRHALLWLLYSRGDINDPYELYGATYPRNFRTWQGLEERKLVEYHAPTNLGGGGYRVLTTEGLRVARILLAEAEELRRG